MTNMRVGIRIVTAIICAITMSAADGAVIRLKNGSNVEGEVEQVDEETITLHVANLGAMTFSKKEVETIDGKAWGAAASQTAVGNAAPYYAKAFDLFQFPASTSSRAQIEAVIESGWKNDPTLQELVLQDQSWLQEFKKGLGLERCDFGTGTGRGDPVNLNIVKIRNLVYLLLLRARYLESQGQIEEAVDLALSTLTFGQHIAQHDTYVAKMLALATEEKVAPVLESIVSSGSSGMSTRETSNFLARYESTRFQIEEFDMLEEQAKKDEETLGSLESFDPRPYRKGREQYQIVSKRLEDIRQVAARQQN